jgi:uncharacterized protein
MDSLLASFELPTLTIVALLVLTAAVAGLARGFSGFGAALIFVPVASTLVGPKLAAPLLLITDAIVAAPMVWSNWHRADRREVSLMGMGCLVGIPLGTVILAQLDPLSLHWGVVMMVASMLVLLLSGWRYRGPQSSPVSVGVGAMSGVFSGIAQIGGPPVVAYWLGLNREPVTMRASTILFFALGSAIAAVTYSIGGLITHAVLVLSLVLVPSYSGGLILGSRLFGLAAPETFRRICFMLIALALVISLPIWQK